MVRLETLFDALAAVGATDVDESAPEWHAAHCPFAPWLHKGGADRSRSFAATAGEPGRKASFTCKACKQKGSLRDLPLLVASVSGADASRIGDLVRIAERVRAEEDEGFLDPSILFADKERTEARPAPIPSYVYEGIFQDASSVPEARDYVTSRRVMPETADHLGLLWDPEQKRVLFPVKDEYNRLYGFSGRAIYPQIEPKIRDYHFKKRWCLLGLERFDRDKPTILVEGLFALARFVQEGIEDTANVLAILGSEVTPQQISVLTALQDRARKVYLILDGDKAGREAVFGDAAREAGKRKTLDYGALGKLLSTGFDVVVPSYPGNLTDPDDLLREDILGMLGQKSVKEERMTPKIRPISDPQEQPDLFGPAVFTS